MKRFFGHSPWQAKRTAHSRQYRGSVSRLARPNCPLLLGGRPASASASAGCCRAGTSAPRSGRTSRGRRCARAPARCRTSPLKMHMGRRTPTQDASAASNICTYTLPTSRVTHSSNTPIRKRPHCSAPTERSVTWWPSSRYSGRGSLPRSPQPMFATGSISGVTRSTIGISWMNSVFSSSRKKR